MICKSNQLTGFYMMATLTFPEFTPIHKTNDFVSLILFSFRLFMTIVTSKKKKLSYN